MKNTSVILKRSINIYLRMLPFLTLTFMLTGQTLAQKESEVNSQPYKINGKEVKDYLMEKYKLRKDDVSSDFQQTPNGPSGKLYLRGNIKPKNVVIAEDTMRGRARAIAKAFLKEESSLFGIGDIEEIREEGIFINEGHDGKYTRINYRRYVDNLPMLEMYLAVDIGPDEEVTWASAKLVPIPAELYKAVKKNTLTEAEISQIVEDNLNNEVQRMIKDPRYASIDPKDFQTRIFNPQKIAISSYPYVIWILGGGVEKKMEKTFGEDKGMELGSWHYRVDAFTGKILSKIDARIIN